MQGISPEMADTHWQFGRVVQIQRRTSRIKSFFIQPSNAFDFIAGQHVNLRLTANDGYSAVRSYSIASAPERGDCVEVAVERLDDGEVSSFLHDSVAVGDEVELRGPLGGHFIWRHTDGGPVLLFGGGSGVVPLLSMIRHREAVRSSVPTLLLLSARNLDDVPFRDELIALHAKRSGFSFALTLTREPARGSSEFSRRIDSAMVAEVLRRLPAIPTHVFACGANSFVNAALDAALDAGVSASSVRAERYGA